jgi:hypothetical protein
VELADLRRQRVTVWNAMLFAADEPPAFVAVNTAS